MNTTTNTANMTNDYDAYIQWASTQTYNGQPIKPYTAKQWNNMSAINKFGIMRAVNRSR